MPAPKTKFERQYEAIERKRRNFHKELDYWIQFQYGTSMYANLVQSQGQDFADQKRIDANTRFEKFCAEAKVDAHGNPLLGWKL